MKIQILTLIDITQTGARRADNLFAQHQQQNFLTISQSLSLRSNPTIHNSPVQFVDDIALYKFGTEFTGKHRIWKFWVEYEQHSDNILDLLIADLELVPFIPNLNETAIFKFAIFDPVDLNIKNTILIKESVLNS